MDAALAAAAFAAFAATACPGPHWLDSGELIASAWSLGVAHPPGEAAWALLARAAMLIPVGDIAFRANLASAAAAAACLLPLSVLARVALVPGRTEPDGGRGLLLLARGAALAGTLCGAAWLQAVRAEVYALQALLTLSAAAALVLPDRLLAAPGRWGLAALLAGLAAANHPLLLAASLPALGLLAVGGGGGLRLGRLGPALALGALGFSACLIYLPVRAAAAPGDAWGTPDRLGDLIAVLTGRIFAQNFTVGEGAAWGPNAQVLAALVRRHGGPMLLPLAALGAVALARAGRGRLAAGVGLLAAGAAATVLPQNKVFLDNPDLHGYAVAMMAALLLLAAAALGALVGPAAARLPERVGIATYGAAALVLVSVAVPGAAFGARGESTLARDFARGLVAGLPPGAALVTAGNDAAFLLWYADRVEGWRPDLRILHRVLLGHRFYDAELARRHGAYPGGLDPRLVRRDLPAALPSARVPVFVEFRERDWAAIPSLIPRGVVMEWRGPSPAPIAASDLERHRALLEAALPPGDPAALGADEHARRVTLYARALLGAFFAERGHADLAAEQAALIRRLDPGWSGRWPSAADDPWPPPGAEGRSGAR